MGRELAAAREESHTLQALWVSRQRELVALTRSNTATSGDISAARSRLAVLQRKHGRLEGQCAELSWLAQAFMSPHTLPCCDGVGGAQNPTVGDQCVLPDLLVIEQCW
jgi:hypothetical protein